MPMTYHEALASFSQADRARKAAWRGVTEAERVLEVAKQNFWRADEVRLTATARVDDAWRREQHAAGNHVTFDDKAPTPTTTDEATP